MGYKKLVSLLAVSALALGACADDTAEEEPTVDETEEVEEVDETTDETTDETADDDAADEEGTSTEDLIQQAQDQSGEAFPEYGLYVPGNWTEDGIVVDYEAGGAATVAPAITTEHEAYNVYLVEDGVITDVVSDDPAPEFTVEAPSDDVTYHVGISPDDLGEAGDEVAEDDFYRVDTVLFQEVEPAAEEE